MQQRISLMTFGQCRYERIGKRHNVPVTSTLHSTKVVDAAVFLSLCAYFIVIPLFLLTKPLCSGGSKLTGFWINKIGERTSQILLIFVSFKWKFVCNRRHKTASNFPFNCGNFKIPCKWWYKSRVELRIGPCLDALGDWILAEFNGDWVHCGLLQIE